MKTNNIFVFSRARFKDEILKMNEDHFLNGAFISIHSPKVGMSFNDTESILESSSNVLNLWFHDADPISEEPLIFNGIEITLEPTVLFDTDMALQIHQFVKQNEKAKFWIIHCTAGISRSGAVGEILSEYFHIPYQQFKRDNPQVNPNIYVKNILKQIMIYDENI